MKKNLSGVFFSRKYLIRTMKIYSLLLCITISKLFSFSAYSQNISISLNDVSLQMALEEIEQKSEYSFFYNNSLVDISKKVSLTAHDEKIKNILNELFNGTDVDFKIYKNQIVLFPKNANTSNKEVKKLLDLRKKGGELDDPLGEDKEALVKKSIQNPIKGEVKGDDGAPLPGTNVVIKGTDKGALTDFDGKYEITANKGDVLVFSYLGFISKEITVGETDTINVTLQENVNILNEVILTGYTTQRKSRITGAAVSVKPDLIQGTPRAVLQESLQGNIAGLQVVSNTGQPGDNPTVRIRGIGSFGASPPLYVLDGLQVSAATVASINPGDVVNISVLKDAAATSIYGARGANGVIVITTSTGKAGKSVVKYSTQTGFSTPTVAGRFKPLSTPELQELLIEGAINAGDANNESEALQYIVDEANFNPDVNTDWYDEIIRTGNYTQHDLSISGGSEKTQFYLSGGYFKQQGVVQASDFERMNTRLRVNHQLNDRLSFDANLSYNKDVSNTRPSGGNRENPIWALYRARPDQSVFNPDGTFNLSFNNGNHPIALAEAETRRNIRHRILGGITSELKMGKGLSLVGLISTNTTFLDNFVRLPASFSDSAALEGIGSQETDILFDYTVRGLLKYDITLADRHNINAFVGYEVTKSRTKRTDIRVNRILDNFTDLANASLPITASTGRAKNGINSLFVNGEYSFDDRYLLSASLRRDGSSRFGEANQFGTFWSVGVGWNVAKERFMQGQNVFDDLKFRGSYGINGSDNIAGNGFISRFGTNDYNDQQGFFFEQIGNPDLKWEENTVLDVGTDFSLFNSRISGSFDWYTRTTKDLLRDVPISATNGVLSIPSNIGEMKNTGFEIELSSKNIVSNNNGFGWVTDLNFSKNENEVTKLANDNQPIINLSSIISVGEDINTFYLPVYAGVDPALGEALWYTDDTRTEVTNNYNQADQGIVGNTTPDFYAGLRNTFSYRGFSMGFQLYTAWGGSIYDQWGRFTNSDGSRATSNTGNVSQGTYERRWQQPGDVTDVPAYVFNNRQTGFSSQRSSRFIYDGSYIRLREAELAYTFPSEYIEKLSLSRLKVYVKGNNLWTYIHDDRLERDPEAGLGGTLFQNIPITKTLFLGLDISF